MIDKIDATVIKLNRETKEGKINWASNTHTPTSVGGGEKLLDLVYTAKVKETYLRIYKYQYKNWYDEDAYNLTEGYRLEFIDEDNKTLWQFPDDSTIRDLYEAVRYKTSNAESFFDTFLNE